MSFLDDEPSENVIKTFAGKVFQPEKIKMQSDVYMVLMGMRLGKPGTMIVNGKDLMAIAVDQTG